MKIFFDDARPVCPHVWDVRLFPEHAALLPGDPVEHGKNSIVLVDSPCFQDPGDQCDLSFEMGQLRVVAIGWADRGLVILAPEKGADAPSAPVLPRWLDADRSA
jgi:hypothetical protein